MSLFGKAGRRGRGRDRIRTTRPSVELFEDRTLLSQVAIVTNTSADPTVSGSLGFELNFAKNNFTAANPGTIEFQIPGTSPFVISPTATLDVPAYTTVDGSTESAFLGSAAVIQINGGNQSIDGLTVVGTDSTINDLEIVDFNGAGIRVESTADTITANLIGTDGTAADNTLGNQEGIWVDGANGGSAATIGGTTAADANIIGFNTTAGVSISGAAAGNAVLGNFIGTDSSGDNLGNQVGVSISASGNTVGGAGAGAGNTIGFNTLYGVSVVSGSGDVVSQNTYTGTNGPASPVQANDISIASGANNNQPAPTLVSAAYDTTTDQLLLQAWESNAPGTPQTLEIYLDTPGQRTFEISTSVTLSNNSSTPTQFSVPVPGLASGDQIIATLTDPTNGTSAFSAAATIASGNVVTDTNDTGAGSLRLAVDYANAHPNSTIIFNIPGTGPFIIDVPTTALSDLTAPTTIDGTTESSYLGSAAVVQINGEGNSFDGLTLGANSEGSTIEGLEIVDFAGNGIRIESAGDTVAGNLIGTDGTAADNTLGNQTGIFIDGANGGTAATVGGTTAVAANTIGFNTAAGISIGGTGATSDLVEGNLIGTNASSQNLGNFTGISISSSANTIGGTATGAANTIGSNTEYGVDVDSGTGNVVSGNLYTGTNGPASPVQVNDINLNTANTANNNQPPPTFVSALYDVTTGKLLLQAWENSATPPPQQTLELYLDTPGQRTLKLSTLVTLSNDSTNPTQFSLTLPGLAVGDQLIATLTDPTNGTSEFSAAVTVFAGNVVINTADSGIGSLRSAINFANAEPGTTIDFNIPAPGPYVIDVPTTPLPTLIQPTTIDGTTESTFLGQSAVVQIDGEGNSFDGIILGAGSQGSVVKGLEIVDFTGGAGIHIESSGDTVTGNLIGTDGNPADSTIGNQTGIFIDGANGGTNATIGGTTADANVIGFNTTGVSIGGSGTTSDVIAGNFIGTNSSGLKLGNTTGISVSTNDNMIGGTASDDANVIGNNTATGLAISGSDNTVATNDIGTDSFADKLTNPIGISITGSDNTVGGTTADANVIGYSTAAGVSIGGTTNTVAGNFIGTDSAGDNLLNAIGISVDSTGNTIGGTDSSAANTVGFNSTAGVLLAGSGNTVAANFIGTSASNADLGNAVGVSITSSGNTVGGTDTSAANTIGFNTAAGVSISGTSNTVSDNFIGTNSAQQNLGNVVGVSISASNNTIGGVTAGDVSIGNSIGFSARYGVSVLSGTGNVISENQYDGSNGPVSPVQANDINLATNANNNQPAPVLVSAALSGSTLILRAYVVSTVAPPSQTLEIYLDTPGGRSFVVSTTVTLSNDPSNPTQFTVTTSGLASGDSIIATLTNTTNAPPQFATNGTSAFSTSVNIAFANVVTNTNDSGPGSLRAAIDYANLNPNATISFQIPTGPFVIDLQSALAPLTQPTIIDGNTESAFLNGQPAVVQINGGGGAFDGLTLGAGSGGSTVEGLDIVHFAGNGIHIESSGDTITDDTIGVDATMNPPTALGNQVGIFIDGANGGSAATIGGTTAPAANIIGSNTVAGISISGAAATDNFIVGNFIGTDPAGDPLGNAIGVAVATTGNTVGGTAPGAANIIGFNTTGISITADGIVIQGNDIGTDSAGRSLGNATGIAVNASGAVIGGIASGAQNIIAANTATGISINGTGVTENVVVGNVIGTKNNGNAIGVAVATTGNTVGGTASGDANTIGFNTTGISLTASGNTAEGNDVGTDAAGDNQGNATGIAITSGGNMIGGANTLNNDGTVVLPLLGNVIGFNTDAGVSISGAGATGNTLLGNYVGVDPSNPKTGLGNAVGIAIGPGASGNTVGGTALDGNANVIGFNSTAGVQISGSNGNTVEANYVGTEPGNYDLANLNGIVLASAGGNTVTANVIAFSNPTNVNVLQTGDGILIEGTAGAGNTVTSNFIGTDSAGNVLPNRNGVEIDGSSANIIGSTAAGAGNIIAANTNDGILLDNSAGGNSIQGNMVGADYVLSGGIFQLGNLNGIEVQSGATGNLIGGSDYMTSPSTGAVSLLGASANTIAGNLKDGVVFDSPSGTTAASNTISGNLVSQNSHNGIEVDGPWNAIIEDNFIGTDATGTTTYNTLTGQGLGNLLSGIQISGSVSGSISGNVISGNGLSGITASNTGTTILGTPVLIQDNLIGTDKNGTSVSTLSRLPLGNVLDGIRLTGVSGVTIGGAASGGAVSLDLATSGGNLIAGNLGRGIELDDGATDITIGANLIGVVFQSSAGVPTAIAPTDLNSGANTGNLSDGIFLFESATSNTIQGNVISANRGYGIQASNPIGTVALSLQVVGNFIGTNNDGTVILVNNVSFGNGADGIFLDGVSAVTIGGTASTDGNVISGNKADGIDLLQSANISIWGNKIGTNVNGYSEPGTPSSDFGNDSDGVFINQSSSNTVGGTLSSAAVGSLGESNIIAGNHGDGVFVSGTAGPANMNDAENNVISGNYIGISMTGPNQFAVVPNAVAGVILSNADYNRIGGSSASMNVISGNSLDGILLVNDAEYNSISFNNIGTDPNGVGAVPNSADGIFLLGSNSASGTIPDVAFNSSAGTVTGNVISNNVISGNNENGVQILGSGATDNVVASNTIGLGAAGASALTGGGNKGNGVYLNNDGGGNTIGGSIAAAGNVISGNAQSGVLIFGTAGVGGSDTVEDNLIGTDASGNAKVGNGGNGVFIYGTQSNSITGNTVAGNAQAGVSIFSPATSAPAQYNSISDNWIGVVGSGTQALPNQSDGVDIFSGNNNVIGPGNVISGNVGNGVLIAQVSDVQPNDNTVAGNFIGVGSDGATGVGNQQNGVLVENGTGNTIGATTGGTIAGTNVPATPGNVISANVAAGIQFTGNTANNVVQGDYIGVNASGFAGPGLGNGLAGVFINDLSPHASNETIGGTTPGAGNIIAGSSSGFGVDILGPAVANTVGGNYVQGNLIGIDRNNNPSGNSIGVYIQNSAGNVIGGSGNAMNVISANSQAGVELTGLYSTGNVIQGNEIGTDKSGTMRPGGVSPLSPAFPVQTYGIYITTPSPLTGGTNNLVLSNVISGNLIGINITGVGSGTGTAGQGVPLGLNLIQGNKIGTDPTGMSANPNFEYGVYIDNSAGNTVSGGNIISANGVDGIEIFGGTTQSKASGGQTNAAAARNVIVGNVIGMNAMDQAAFTSGSASVQVPDGPVVTLGEQLYGVVVIGSSDNSIGTKSQGNIIGGNVQAGVYITKKDFEGNVYAMPTNNTVMSNMIVSNGVYGVYRYESPDNAVTMRPQRHANKFRGNAINLADYVKNLNGNTQLHRLKSKYSHKTHHHTTHHKTVKVGRVKSREVVHETVHAHAQASATSRPRVPALFEAGVITTVIKHDHGHGSR